MPKYAGAADIDEKIKIESVLSGTVTISKDLLYASKIDKEAVSNAIATYKQNISSAVESGTSYIDNVTSTLQSTNSKRLYSGEEATKQIGNINLAKENLETIKSNNDLIDETEIENIIDQYNSKLVELKHEARLKLLQQKADEFNAQQNIESEREWTETQSDPMYLSTPYKETTFTGGVVKSEIKITSGPTYDQNSLSYTQTVKQIKYKYINYWKWIKGDHWFNFSDDNAKELEAKFRENGLEIPYDESLIIDYE
ncbi:MAG: hypothetical protein Q4F33_06525 [Mycoplasmatota bacterium]|nr:hypothetical protein [Mycoplasmatota bacterium]